MPTVTALTPQARRPDRVSVFVDGAFAVGLAADVAADLGLAVGAALAEEEVAALGFAAELDRAYDRALRYLRTRLRSRREIELRLARYGYAPPIIGAVLEILEERGLCDDAAFAGAWVRDRVRLKPKGRCALRAELAARGVDKEIVEAALATDFTAPEEELARRALEPRVGAFLAKGERRGKTALAAFLARRGFGGELAARLAREVFG